jgi:hypothetical protein
MDAVKFYDIEEGGTAGGNYQIVVRFQGRKVLDIIRPTMLEAQQYLETHGYKRVAWAEGQRIVLQGE